MQAFTKYSCQDIRKFQQGRNTGWINKEQSKIVCIMKTENIK